MLGSAADRPDAESSMKISGERLRELVQYDPLTGDFTWLLYRNGKAKVGDKAGWINDKGYNCIMLDGNYYRSARLAFFYMMDRWPAAEIDHKNRVQGDDRWDNLREATHAQNQANKGRSKKSTSGLKGVSFDKVHQRWRATIQINNKSFYLGLFTSPEYAHKAYSDAAREAFGEFARAS